MIEIKNIEDSDYSEDGCSLKVCSKDGADEYVIKKLKLGSDCSCCLYEVIKNGELTEDMETKKDLLNSVVCYLANNQKCELSMLVLMMYLECCSNGTDNLWFIPISNEKEKLTREFIYNDVVVDKTGINKKDFSIILIETNGALQGHISTLIVDRKRNKYYLLDPSEDVHQEKIRNKMHIRGEVFEKSELDKDTTVLNKDGILLQNEWSCTYWAMCSTKVFLSKNSIEEIITNDTLRVAVFNEIVEEIKSINKGLINAPNCGKFRRQLESNQERQAHR